MMFTFSLPPPLNQTYRTAGGRIYKSRAAREWEEEAGWVVKRTWGMNKTMVGNVRLVMRLFLLRERDLDASIKITMDLLDRQGVYKNDKQVTELQVIKFVDKEWPRMEVSVEEV